MSVFHLGQEQIFMGTYFHEGALDHENHENFCLVKISHYVVFSNYCWVYSLIKACYYVANGLAGLYHGKGLKSHGCQASLSNTVKHFTAIDAAASCCLAHLENGKEGECRPWLKSFSAAQEKGEDHSWAWGSIQVPY